MALSADHRVWSWGWGVHGQLGVGSIEDSLLPTHVTALDEYEVTLLAAGYSHSAALTSQVGNLVLGMFVGLAGVFIDSEKWVVVKIVHWPHI